MKLIEKLKKKRNIVKYWREKGVTIGEDCEIYGTVEFGSEPYLVEIGNHVRVSSGTFFVTHDGGTWVLRKYLNDESLDLFAPIRVGNNVHIGTDVTIMPGVTIGNNCIIGCGAIVTKDVPDNSIAVGVPARVIESIDEYEEKHHTDFDHTKQMSLAEKREYLLKKFYGTKA